MMIVELVVFCCVFEVFSVINRLLFDFEVI